MGVNVTLGVIGEGCVRVGIARAFPGCALRVVPDISGVGHEPGDSLGSNIILVDVVGGGLEVVLGLQGGEEGVREEVGRRRGLHTHTTKLTLASLPDIPCPQQRSSQDE